MWITHEEFLEIKISFSVWVLIKAALSAEDM